MIDFSDSLPLMTDDQLVAAAAGAILLCVFAGDARQQTYVDACAAEAARRGKPALYHHAYMRASSAYPMQQATTSPKGCICPPTSEKTCQRFDCGRKDMKTAIRGAAYDR